MERRHYSEPMTAYYNPWLSGRARTEFVLDDGEWEKVMAIANDSTRLDDSRLLTKLLQSNSTDGRHKGEHNIMFLDEKDDQLLHKWEEVIKASTEIEIKKTVNRKLK